MYEKGKKSSTARFALKSDGAKEVCVAGEFSNWKPVKMRQQKGGMWTATVNVTGPTMEYKFTIDGQWITDPDNTACMANSLGTFNSIANL